MTVDQSGASYSRGVDVSAVTKTFGALRALNAVSLSVAPGEFVALLGPSGCGKTTLLRAVAGLLDIDAGALSIGDQLVAAPAKKVFARSERRRLGMVFQDYALWPHLRVRDNVGFPLNARSHPLSERPKLIEAALRRVEMWAFADKFPGELSGGQQQRVALARAIVDCPSLILFDEPLSNLDAGLRDSLGRQIASLTRELGATAIYVTHDQSEALGLADRVAVMRAGEIVQIDAPERLYSDPADAWVAAFLKSGSLVDGEVRRGAFAADSSGEALVLEAAPSLASSRATILLPGAALSLDDEGELNLLVAGVHFKGDRYEIVTRWGGRDGPFVRFWHDRALARGAAIRVRVDQTKIRIFPLTTPNPSAN
jgi:iron(III) transport system ATP-binding protein